MDEKEIFQGLENICNMVSRENNIPFSAFIQLFQIAEIAAHFLAIFSFGLLAPEQNQDMSIAHKKKKKRRIVR